MVRLETSLIVISPARPTQFLFCAGSQARLPRQDVTNSQSCYEAAASLLESALGVSARMNGKGWVELEPLPLLDSPTRTRDNSRLVTAPFVCAVPLEFVKAAPDYQWRTMAEALSMGFADDDAEIIYSAQRNL